MLDELSSILLAHLSLFLLASNHLGYFPQFFEISELFVLLANLFLFKSCRFLVDDWLLDTYLGLLSNFLLLMSINCLNDLLWLFLLLIILSPFPEDNPFFF